MSETDTDTEGGTGVGADAGADAEAQAASGTGGGGDGGERGPHDKAREGLAHLQAAARELIQAARAMLDVAEDLVNDPEAVASVAATVGSLGDLVRHRATAAARGEGDPPGPAGPQGPPGSGDDALERITVV